MILILLASILCITLIIERLWSLRRKKILPTKILSELDQLIRGGKKSDIVALCRAADIPLTRILQAGAEAEGAIKAEIRNKMEMRGRSEASGMEKYLNFLGTLATVGPLLGLLGTVTGMIQTFAVIRVLGVGDPMKLSGGIAEALLSTAGGLIVGIPALIFQHYFLHRVEKYVMEMEEFSERFLSLVSGEP